MSIQEALLRKFVDDDEECPLFIDDEALGEAFANVAFAKKRQDYQTWGDIVNAIAEEEREAIDAGFIRSSRYIFTLDNVSVAHAKAIAVHILEGRIRSTVEGGGM